MLPAVLLVSGFLIDSWQLPSAQHHNASVVIAQSEFRTPSLSAPALNLTFEVKSSQFARRGIRITQSQVVSEEVQEDDEDVRQDYCKTPGLQWVPEW